ncbi:hypothetical protein J6590_038469 [Homalodisca vitripennis]|nr:hypothetical protein J6590_038469 [Homalodisca vitripennis]
MGRVKKQKLNMKKRNLEKIGRRWGSEKHSGDGELMTGEGSSRPSVESVASTSGFISRRNPQSALDYSIRASSSSDNEVSNKPTGFALYTSYKENIEISDDGPQYGFIDFKILTEYLASFPCNNCYCETLEVTHCVCGLLAAEATDFEGVWPFRESGVKTLSCSVLVRSPRDELFISCHLSIMRGRREPSLCALLRDGHHDGHFS